MRRCCERCEENEKENLRTSWTYTYGRWISHSSFQRPNCRKNCFLCDKIEDDGILELLICILILRIRDRNYYVEEEDISSLVKDFQ
jgi:hypothetical protein